MCYVHFEGAASYEHRLAHVFPSFVRRNFFNYMHFLCRNRAWAISTLEHHGIMGNGRSLPSPTSSGQHRSSFVCGDFLRLSTQYPISQQYPAADCPHSRSYYHLSHSWRWNLDWSCNNRKAADGSLAGVRSCCVDRPDTYCAHLPYYRMATGNGTQEADNCPPLISPTFPVYLTG